MELWFPFHAIYAYITTAEFKPTNSVCRWLTQGCVFLITEKDQRVHSKLHGIGIDQQGFLEAQQDFQLYHVYQASDSLCAHVLERREKKIKEHRRKNKWINQVVLSQNYNAAAYFSATLCSPLKHKC